MVDVAANAPVVPTPARSHVTHAWLSQFVFAELLEEANRRRLHPDVLTARIVEKAICRGLVDEIVD